MQIEAPPTERDTTKPDVEQRGLVVVHSGNGTGKGAAAFGLALRAHGCGEAVHICQFMEVPSARGGWARAEALIRGGEHFLVVLDEIAHPLRYGWLLLVPAQRGIED